MEDGNENDISPPSSPLSFHNSSPSSSSPSTTTMTPSPLHRDFSRLPLLPRRHRRTEPVSTHPPPASASGASSSTATSRQSTAYTPRGGPGCGRCTWADGRQPASRCHTGCRVRCWRCRRCLQCGAGEVHEPTQTMPVVEDGRGGDEVVQMLQGDEEDDGEGEGEEEGAVVHGAAEHGE